MTKDDVKLAIYRTTAELQECGAEIEMNLDVIDNAEDMLTLLKLIQTQVVPLAQIKEARN